MIDKLSLFDNSILNDPKTISIIPQKLFINNQFLSEDTVKIVALLHDICKKNNNH